jgi:hypothetical protein
MRLSRKPLPPLAAGVACQATNDYREIEKQSFLVRKDHMISLPHEPPLQNMSSENRKFLADAKVPQGPFNPAGAWKQNWEICLSSANKSPGTLVLEKKPRQDGTFDLLADWRVQQSMKSFQRLHAEVNCQADDLGTPMSWQAQSSILQSSGEPIDGLTIKQAVKVKDGVLELSFGGAGGDVRRYADQPLKTWSSNWSLLEAVQRLGGKEIKPMSFSMLEYLDGRKNEQVLSSLGVQEITLGGRNVRLRGYQQLGRGILPMEYWLDEQQRLVLVLGRQQCLLATEEGAKI